ncbi:PucR family transcriptional regulator [Oceanobacillus bengalensis]|uniref:PucR C-terminal helix-turn-helix domain-containing protein n=1 Tax=Oceanobacillus bengalensis TaxID=1435466 RepID=A0A494Z8C7_9BACI|nr:helix-turn-helix domain-containing protein [Oceanobacillus bengalensis]RKQ18787.1 hypothetical protein D8M05_01375 [Oceanobacillus bengalensis]
MIKQLAKIFSSLYILQESREVVPKNHEWFITDDNQIIGIDKKELTKKDIDILSTFLSTYNINIPRPTEQEQRWKSRILSNDFQELETPFRFVYFTISKNQIDPLQFREAIYNLFSHPVPILWESEKAGVIIEEQSTFSEEAISYEQIIDILMSDLYTNIRFYVGPYIDTFDKLKYKYDTFLKNVGIAFSYSDQSVVTYIDAISFHFIEQADKHFMNEIKTIVLKELIDDEELLHSIKVFISSNLNVSEAAKKLHLHRNSLQYRLDKFIEKTGIDVRRFNEAVAVYLVILSMMHKS